MVLHPRYTLKRILHWPVYMFVKYLAPLKQVNLSGWRKIIIGNQEHFGFFLGNLAKRDGSR